MEYGPIILFAILVVYLAMALRIANEHERFAVFALGRFVALKGPGLMVRFPGSASVFHRVALGAECEVQSNDLVLIDNCAVPFTAKESVRSGAKVRICGFEADRVEIEPLQRVVVCEKCGHKNVV
jgi:hypothetical protein